MFLQKKYAELEQDSIKFFVTWLLKGSEAKLTEAITELSIFMVNKGVYRFYYISLSSK